MLTAWTCECGCVNGNGNKECRRCQGSPVLPCNPTVPDKVVLPCESLAEKDAVIRELALMLRKATGEMCERCQFEPECVPINTDECLDKFIDEATRRAGGKG
jgi:hypothetical protein